MSVIEVPIEFQAVIELLENAILKRHFVNFYYESGSGNKGFRIILPYMIIPRKNVLELVGLPVEELRLRGQPRHYTISQLSKRLKLKQLEILPETFSDPGVSRDKVLFTETPPVCRFVYDNENQKKIKAGWTRIRYLK